MKKPLDAYQAKRDFSRTPEPAGGRRKAKGGNSYVVQKHAARRLHYDFRLELNGVLKSWAVPEGPSLVAGVKRLAVHVEDHPLEYGGFEGVIPPGEYGGGTVMVWDRGTWTPDFDPDFGYGKGHLKFHLDGEKLKGQWHLVRMARKPREKQEAWLLFKSDDEAARAPDAADILAELPDSAASGRSMQAIAEEKDRVWSSKQGEIKREKPAKAPIIKASAIPKAKAGPLPSFVEPSLPTTVERAPSGPGWVHEIKHDGYRVQARVENGRARLLTRQGLDWSEKFAAIGKAVGRLPVTSALIDGEIVVQTEAGIASFSALQDALSSGAGGLVYFAFDLLHLDGYDLRASPLSARRAALAKILTAADGTGVGLRFSDHVAGDGDTIFRHACRLGLEGIVSKKASAPYRSGRVKTWVRIRCAQSGPFVIAGFVPSSLDRNAVGALVLGEFVDGKLTPSGHVGTGFTAASGRALFKRLDALRVKIPPLKDDTAEAKAARWVEPSLVAEIEHRGRTAAGLIRHAAFKGLLDDRDPSEVVRPTAEGLASAPRPAEKPLAARLTNPARLLWPEQGITKRGLAEFYSEIAGWILPHIAGRALSLVRCPGGVNEPCFFQKHRWAGLGKGVRLVPVPGDDEPMVAIDDLAGLLELVQAGVLEIHPWGAMANQPELPDRVTMDLDPGDDVPWEYVVEAALDVRARLADVGLRSFVKTTGGKGLHVVFPLVPKAGWDAVKAFAQTLSERMAAERPERYTDNMAKRVRRGRIYVDYLRNGRGATAIAAYSTRARVGAAVSTPLDWDELGPAIRANQFTIDNLPQRLAFLDRDPWRDLRSLKQELPDAAAPVAAKRGERRPKAAAAPAAPAEHEVEILPAAVVPPKAALAVYWKKAGGAAVEFLGRRPLELVRHVDGVTFVHRGPLPPLPDAVRTVDTGPVKGGAGVRAWVDSIAGLLGLLDIGVIELHPWSAGIDDLERPDTLVFVIDPASDATTWKSSVAAALALRDHLAEEGLESWPKLTGDGGLHVMAPIEPDLDWKEAQAYAKAIAGRVASPAIKSGKLSVGWQRNSRGGATIGAWSPRAQKGLPIAAPVRWKELAADARPDAFTLKRLPRRP